MATSLSSEGPVLSLINKRIRALRKKYNRILQMEDSISQGKPINKEQEEVLRSKPTVSALIDELEKLREPLSSALTEELHQTQQHSPNDVVEDLLNVLYFGPLFDVKSQNDFTSTTLTRTHERGCCLTYDYVTDDATYLLAENDLDSIASLAGFLVSRPADSRFSHKDALQRCVQHAKLWLARAQHPIHDNSHLTHAVLRERLNKIMSSDYFTTSPEMKAPVEVAAAGNYTSFQVPVVSVQVEDGSNFHYQDHDKDEGTANLLGLGSGDDQSDPDRELQKDEIEAETAVELGSFEQEQTKPQMDVGSNRQDVEVNEQQYHRRSYQNQRGGRGVGGDRRGYSNGRGGRGCSRGVYQNGRNQYHDQPGNYPRNNYYNNRGRGGRGVGHSFNNHGSGVQVNHVAGHIGVVES